MSGHLNEILPEPISDENEEIIVNVIKRKMKSAASLSVELLHIMEKRFGPEAREVMKELVHNRMVDPRPDPGKPEEDLRDFCENLDKACAGSHRWRRILEEKNAIAYEYSRCMWAEIFNELDEPELGFYYCAGDDPNTRSYNPAMRFSRSKVLMNGDDICDHRFFLEKENGESH